MFSRRTKIMKYVLTIVGQGYIHLRVVMFFNYEFTHGDIAYAETFKWVRKIMVKLSLMALFLPKKN